MLAVGPLGILVLHCRDLDHLAVITLAAQPAKKGAFEHVGDEPVSLGTPMLARHRYTRCVNDVGLDAARLEPARQPETVTASLKGDCNALDPASCFLRFLSPSMQQLQQCALVDRELFQRLALDARHDTSNEPARKAHLNDRNQRAVRLEGGEGSAQVVQLLHGVAPSVHISDDGMQYPRRRPIASSIMGFEDEVEQSFGRPCRQCDGRFKRTYELTSSIVPRGTSFHRWVDLRFLLFDLIPYGSHAATTSLVHRNSVPSTQMRCMTTANRRASATIAFFIPRCLAIFIAQALSQDHLAECTSMLWAAS